MSTIASGACCRDTGAAAGYTVTQSRVNEDAGLNCFKSYVVEEQRVFTLDSKPLTFWWCLKSIFANLSLKWLLMEKNLICSSRILLNACSTKSTFHYGLLQKPEARRCCGTVVVNPRKLW